MNKEIPYSPHPLHRIYERLELLPLPMWLFYLLLLIILGLVMHPFSWTTQVIPDGQFDIYTLLSFSWVIESLALGHYAYRASGKVLDGYRSQLPIDDENFSKLRYSFTTIPRNWGTVWFFTGAVFGFLMGWSVVSSTAAGIPFPYLIFVSLFQWAFSLGLAIMFSYFIIRQMNLMKTIFSLPKQIQLRNLSPIYAFSRYMAVLAIGTFVIADLNGILLAPESFNNIAVTAQSYIFVIFSLAMFYYPLRGINQRISQEKNKRLNEVNNRIERMFDRIHAADEAEMYDQSQGMRSLLGALTDERAILAAVPTWPWKPGTFLTLLTTLLLPVVIGLAQSLIRGILNI